MRKNNVLNTYQCWFQSVHFISFTVYQNDMRRFQFPNKTRSLSVIRVGRKWNIRNLKYKVIRCNHHHRWSKISILAVYFLSGCTFILKNRSSNRFIGILIWKKGDWENFLFQPYCCIRSFEKAYHMIFTREKSSHICCHLTLHIILMIFGIFCQHKAAYVHNIWCKWDWICTFCLCFVVF